MPGRAALSQVGDVTGTAKLLYPDDFNDVAIDFLTRLCSRAPWSHGALRSSLGRRSCYKKVHKCPFIPSLFALSVGATRSASPRLQGRERYRSCSPPPWHLVRPYPTSVQTKRKNGLVPVSALPTPLVCAVREGIALKNPGQKGLWGFAFIRTQDFKSSK